MKKKTLIFYCFETLFYDFSTKCHGSAAFEVNSANCKSLEAIQKNITYLRFNSYPFDGFIIPVLLLHHHGTFLACGFKWTIFQDCTHVHICKQKENVRWCI